MKIASDERVVWLKVNEELFTHPDITNFFPPEGKTPYWEFHFGDGSWMLAEGRVMIKVEKKKGR